LEDTLFVFPMGDRLAHFTVGGLAPLHNKHADYLPRVQRQFYRWGLDCRMVEKSDFTNSLLPPADKMATAVIDNINYHIDTARGRNSLHALYPSLTAAGIDVSQHKTKSALTTGRDRRYCYGRRGRHLHRPLQGGPKPPLSPPSPLCHYPRRTIHLMPDPIKPRFLCLYRVPKPALEEGEALPFRHVPHTYAALTTHPFSDHPRRQWYVGLKWPPRPKK
jgi:hypothetical protein